MIKKLISCGVLDLNIFKQKYAKYGVQGIIGSSEPRKFAFDIGLRIIKRIEKDFNISIPRANYYSKIDKEEWTRFCRIFFKDI